MNKITSYCIELTPGQLDYLAGSKYGIDRMKILHCLISAVVLKETVYSIKGFNTTLQAGQAIMSEVDLSSRLHYDKKTISRVLDRMNELGIVATTQSNRTSPLWMRNKTRCSGQKYRRSVSPSSASCLNTASPRKGNCWRNTEPCSSGCWRNTRSNLKKSSAMGRAYGSLTSG